jgi:hypothetical protein
MHPATGRMFFLIYFAPMIKLIFSVFTVNFFFCLSIQAQTEKTPYASNTTKTSRASEYKNLVNNSISKNLLLPLTDSTEENWQDAFDAMLLLNYRTPFIDARIRSAMDSVEYRSVAFQKAMLQLIYPLYPKDFVPQVISLAKQTNDPKLFAMCSEYLFINNKTETYKTVLLKRMDEMQQKAGVATEIPFFTVLKNKLSLTGLKQPPVADLLNNTFLPNEMVVYSFQRKNRNYPGLVMVRSSDGKFIKDAAGKYFAVPQLARSGTNMPGYLTDGNTPQGMFKIFGFAVSQGSFIGPTTNIQMVLPYEHSTDVSDSVTQSLGDNYRFLLPGSWKNYYPFYEAYYAGKAGRTEIIAHGTTVNPAYYAKQPYYPLTPTQGCLCTKEIWSAVDGKRIESDQQKLVDAVKKAGGANGYCIVIEIDDQQKPVSLKDILPFLK